MAEQSRVDWTLSYLARHANEAKRPTRDAYQPSLYDALEDAPEEVTPDETP
jgi:hypothetical protein